MSSLIDLNELDTFSAKVLQLSEIEGPSNEIADWTYRFGVSA